MLYVPLCMPIVYEIVFTGNINFVYDYHSMFSYKLPSEQLSRVNREKCIFVSQI